MSNTVRGSLPERPSLDQLRKQAKELRASGQFPTLTAAQLALARDYGFPSWPKLKLHVEQTALRRIIHDGETEKLKTLLAENTRLANLPYAEGGWPLHQAAEYNDPAMIELLVQAGASLRPKYDRSAHTALSWAVTCWSYEAGMKLVELGEKPDLFCAAGLGLLPEVQSFWRDGKLQKGPSQTGSSRVSDTGEPLPAPPPSDRDQVSDALYIACRSGRLEVSRWLLDHGADPNWHGYAGASCLAWAEFARVPELCALLRERGGSDAVLDQQFKASPRVFALMVLSAWGFPADQLRARLAADPSMVNASGGYGTLLNAAVFNGHLPTVRMLLEMGADRLLKNAAGLTPLELAESKGFEAIATLLKTA